MANLTFTNAARKVFRSELTFAGTPEQVFPQLCPVAEYDWIPDWAGVMVYSDSGVAELGCVFQTETQDGTETWTVSRYEPPSAIEFVRVLPGQQVTKLDIALGRDQNPTPAVVTLTFTALSQAGAEQIAAMTDEPVRGWQKLEKMLNHYLATGTMLTPAS